MIEVPCQRVSVWYINMGVGFHAFPRVDEWIRRNSSISQSCQMGWTAKERTWNSLSLGPTETLIYDVKTTSPSPKGQNQLQLVLADEQKSFVGPSKKWAFHQEHTWNSPIKHNWLLLWGLEEIINKALLHCACSCSLAPTSGFLGRRQTEGENGCSPWDKHSSIFLEKRRLDQDEGPERKGNVRLSLSFYTRSPFHCCGRKLYWHYKPKSILILFNYRY